MPDAHLTYLVEREAAPWSPAIPTSTRSSSSRARAGWRASARRCAAGAAAARRAVRRRDRHARRPAQRVADAGDRRAAADRLRHPGPQLDVHADACPVRASFGRATRSSTSGTAAHGDRRLAEPAPDPARDAVEMAPDPAADRRVADRLRAAASSRPRVDRRPRQRGQPVPALARAGLRRGSSPRSRGRHRTADRAELRAVGSRRRRSDRAPGAPRARARARGARVLDFGDFDLAELRALVARSRLFVGGDTGPLHIAATTDDPGGRRLRTDAAGAIGAVARSGHADGVGGRRRACPAVRATSATCAPGDFRCLTRSIRSRS